MNSEVATVEQKNPSCCHNPDTTETQKSCFLCSKPICANCLVVMEGKEICTSCAVQVGKELHGETAKPQHLFLGLLGGLTAAIATAFLWAYLIYLTGYQSGLFAFGAGFLTSYAVHFSAGRRRAFALQIIGMLCCAISVFLGYWTSLAIYIYKEVTQSELDMPYEELVERIAQVTNEGYVSYFGLFGVLMLAIACYYGWKVNSPRH